jgi:hypothetical protein
LVCRATCELVNLILKGLDIVETLHHLEVKISAFILVYRNKAASLRVFPHLISSLDLSSDSGPVVHQLLVCLLGLLEIIVNLLERLCFLVFVFNFFACESLLDGQLDIHLEPPRETALSAHVSILLIVVNVTTLRALLSVLTAGVTYSILSLNGSLAPGTHQLLIVTGRGSKSYTRIFRVSHITYDSDSTSDLFRKTHDDRVNSNDLLNAIDVKLLPLNSLAFIPTVWMGLSVSIALGVDDPGGDSSCEFY